MKKRLDVYEMYCTLKFNYWKIFKENNIKMRRLFFMEPTIKFLWRMFQLQHNQEIIDEMQTWNEEEDEDEEDDEVVWKPKKKKAKLSEQDSLYQTQMMQKKFEALKADIE